MQVGNRVHGVYLNHMQQFVFSPHGALRLKADIGALVECVKAMDLPTLEEKFNATQVQKQTRQCKAALAGCKQQLSRLLVLLNRAQTLPLYSLPSTCLGLTLAPFAPHL